MKSKERVDAEIQRVGDFICTIPESNLSDTAFAVLHALRWARGSRAPNPAQYLKDLLKKPRRAA